MDTLCKKQQVWLGHVEACGDARVSMKAYAETHGHDLQQFYFWKGQLKRLGIIDAGQNARDVVPASTASAQPLDGKIHIQLAKGVSFVVPGIFDADALSALLKLAVRL